MEAEYSTGMLCSYSSVANTPDTRHHVDTVTTAHTRMSPPGSKQCSTLPSHFNSSINNLTGMKEPVTNTGVKIVTRPEMVAYVR